MIIGIIRKLNFLSCANQNLFILSLTELNYGDCGLMVMTSGCGELVCEGQMFRPITRANLRDPGDEGSIPSFRPQRNPLVSWKLPQITERRFPIASAEIAQNKEVKK